MTKSNQHYLRDVFFLTSPLVGMLGLFVVASVASIVNSEIRGFHGYHLSAPRAGGISQFFKYTEDSLVAPESGVFLSDDLRQTSPLELLDLRVDGTDLDQFSESLPASGKEWAKAVVMSDGVPHEVEVRYRGSRFSNFIFREKGWKIRTPRDQLIDGRRELNLERGNFNRHLGYLLAREFEIPTPRSRLVRLFINQKDQGVYVDEEAVSELMMRQNNFMPGDIFYGELDIHSNSNAGMASNDLYWNPFLWEKKYLYNRYPEEYRENLSELVEAIDAPGFSKLYSLIDYDEFVSFFAALTYLGDSHTDKAHNHRLYFNPLSGEFSAIPWDLIRGISDPDGVEPIGNRLYRKLCSDPRFLDAVMKNIRMTLGEKQVDVKLVDEIVRVQNSIAPSLAEPDLFVQELEEAKNRLITRTRDIRRILDLAKVSYVVEGQLLTVFATSPATLKLDAIQFERAPTGVTVFEDRDFDGMLSEGDRELSTSIEGTALVFESDGVDLFSGRDFSANYFQQYQPEIEAYAAHRDYTRLAALPNAFLLAVPVEGERSNVVGLTVSNPLTDRPVTATAGKPVGMIASETVHPWSEAPAAKSKEFVFEGVVDLQEDLLVGPDDTLTIQPGTTMRMGAGVSIICRSPVALDGVRFERLSADKPWGVFALQGRETSSSKITNCDFSGGSDDTVAHVYYSGMLSVHMAENVVLSDSKFARNIIGDDTVRFADCQNLLIDGVEVTDANGDAIDCDISTGTIRDTEVITPQNDGIDLMTADVNLDNVRVRGAGDKGISFGENANPLVTDCQIRDCVIGVAFKDGSNPTLENVLISNCRTGVSGYAKNWRYPGGGRGKLIDSVLEKNRIDVLLDEHSSLVLERCFTDKRYRLPASRGDSLIEINPRKENE